jgi:hypothetical protein
MITQLAAPCWVASWDGDTRDDSQASYGGHYTEPGKIRGFEGFTDNQNACFHKGCDGIVVFGLDGYCPTCGDENVSEDDWEIREITPRRLPQPCWEADCDGPGCDVSLGDDDDEGSHYGTREAAAKTASENLWTIAENVALCGWCNGAHLAEMDKAFLKWGSSGE